MKKCFFLVVFSGCIVTLYGGDGHHTFAALVEKHIIKPTALHKACAKGDLDKVRGLLALGADKNAQDDVGKTPLICAVNNRKDDIILYLINDHKVDLSTLDNSGRSVIDYLREQGRGDLIDVLEKRCIADFSRDDVENDPRLHRAIKENDLDLIIDLLFGQPGDKVAQDITQKNRYGQTALHIACGVSSSHVFGMLLRCGADLHIKDIFGTQPLEYASNDMKALVEETALSSAGNGGGSSADPVAPPRPLGLVGRPQIVTASVARPVQAPALPIPPTQAPVAKVGGGSVVPVAPPRPLGLVGRPPILPSRPVQPSVPLIPAAKPLAPVAGGGSSAGQVIAPRPVAVVAGRPAIIPPTQAPVSRVQVQAPLAGGGAGGSVDRSVGVLKQKKHGLYDLHKAVVLGDISKVQGLLDSGADVHMPNKTGETPLWIAAKDGKVGVVQALLGAGADVNAGMKDGWTPLFIAAQEGKVEVVRALLEAGAEVNAPDKDGRTLLYIAAQAGKVKIVRALLAAGANVNKSTLLNFFERPLYIAAQNGHIGVVRALLGAPGVDVNAKELRGGRTPLCIAADKGKVEVVRELLRAGANPNIKNGDYKGGFRPAQEDCFRIIAEEALKQRVTFDEEVRTEDDRSADPVAPPRPAGVVGRPPIVTAIAPRPVQAPALPIPPAQAPASVAKVGGGSSAGQVAAPRPAGVVGRPPIVTASVARPVPELVAGVSRVQVQAPLAGGGAGGSADRSHALHLAVQNNKISKIKRLLDSGADVNMLNEDGETPLLVASTLGYTDIVELLLKNGAHIDCVCRDGVTPLWQAATKGHIDVLELLLEKGADIDIAEKKASLNPLHNALLYEKLNVVRLLLKKISSSPKKNVILARKTRDLWTALHCAAQHENEAFVEAVLAAGAVSDINSQNVLGDTPLHLAVLNGNKLVVQILLRYSANPRIKNHIGKTALDEANEECRGIITKALQDRIAFASEFDLDQELTTDDEKTSAPKKLEKPKKPVGRKRFIEEDGNLGPDGGGSAGAGNGSRPRKK